MFNIVLNETVMTMTADAAARFASQDCRTPIVAAIGCSKLENSEFARLYLAICEIRAHYKDALWEEPVLLAEELFASIEKERIRRSLPKER